MKYKSQGKPLSFNLFESFLAELPKTNRWVQLGESLPWDKIEKIYNAKLNNRHGGAGNKPARIIIGALFIKHKMGLSDEETEQQTKEYQQLMAKNVGERNEVEATFGTAKRIYRANNIRAKLPDTGCVLLLCEKRKEVPKRTSLCTNFNDKKNGNIRSE